ncbi:3-oxoacyl-(acyl-carrier-protein) reductase [Trichoderma harzianum]|uniref:3-oxoacyl-(Acyl-carrier-protein) reductase n=1 Tax=Trichoderma harzianum TaxID=5544 RepID=A0A0G0AEM9_TRIHA|nr:3-oxoacyl-(acyl-carrier-protein) reductase [Trichoderma harzianum]
MASTDELQGKLALITGASGGIGKACADVLYRQGVRLALTYSSSKADVDRLAEELSEIELPEHFGRPKVSIYQIDMAVSEQIGRVFEEIKAEHGQFPDILLSNAGHGKRIPNLEDISLDEFEYTIRVNLTASFILCKLAVPHMKAKGWGRIILMGSIAGYGGGINGCHYAASKAGLMGMVKNLALKHAQHGITINDIAPAMIGGTRMIPDAQFVEGTPGDVRNIPVGRLGRPEEVANVVIMLCKTGYMTGQSILLSGGLK